MGTDNLPQDTVNNRQKRTLTRFGRNHILTKSFGKGVQYMQTSDMLTWIQFCTGRAILGYLERCHRIGYCQEWVELCNNMITTTANALLTQRIVQELFTSRTSELSKKEHCALIATVICDPLIEIATNHKKYLKCKPNIIGYKATELIACALANKLSEIIPAAEIFLKEQKA